MNEDEKYFMWIYNLAIEHVKEEINLLPLDEESLEIIMEKLKPVTHVTLQPIDDEEYAVDDLVDALIESLIASDSLESELLDLTEEEFTLLMTLMQEEQSPMKELPSSDEIEWEELLGDIEEDLDNE